MKKIMCTLLTIGTVISVGSSPVLAIDAIKQDFKSNQSLTNVDDENNDLTELLDNGKKNYEILDMNGNSIISQFGVGNQKYIIDEIIQDSIPDVWWTRDTYAYNQRCPSWPSYPDWIPAGKYRYRTKYISPTDYTDE